MVLPWQFFCQRVFGQNLQLFLVKECLFLTQKVFRSEVLVQIQNPRLKIDPCAKFQSDCTKDKGNSNWNDTKNCLMTAYLPHSDGVINIIIDFEILYKSTTMPGLVVIGPQIKEQQKGGSKRPQPE